MDSLDKTPALTGSVETGKHKFERQSNIELLRIVATFFILVLHANFQAFGAPSKSEIMDAPAASFLRFLVQAIAVVGVDVFILISGWFGMRPSKKSAANLAFQFFFFTLGIYAIAIVFHVVPVSPDVILNCLCLGRWNWFLRAYIGLLILSPVLNAFSEKASQKHFQSVLIAFFAFEITYGWIARETQGFYKGQSVLSFIGLYLLARYIRRFCPKWTAHHHKFDFLFYVLLAFAISLGGVCSRVIGWKDGIYTTYSNASPFVIAAALFLLLGFSKLNFQNKWINKIAKSSYSTYLFHTHPAILFPLLIPFIQVIAEQTRIFSPLAVFGFLFCVYGTSVLLDQLRLAIWAHLSAFMAGVKRNDKRYS